MLKKKDLYKTSEYWIEELQNELYRQVSDYMKQNNLNQNELAEKWGVSKGYISQILKGNCNFTLKKLTELSLALGKAPIVQYVPTDIYYEFEKISSYVNEQMHKPFEFSPGVHSFKIKVSQTPSPAFVKVADLKVVRPNDILEAA